MTSEARGEGVLEVMLRILVIWWCECLKGIEKTGDWLGKIFYMARVTAGELLGGLQVERQRRWLTFIQTPPELPTEMHCNDDASAERNS
jgi:hypothetical protein